MNDKLYAEVTIGNDWPVGEAIGECAGCNAKICAGDLVVVCGCSIYCCSTCLNDEMDRRAEAAAQGHKAVSDVAA